MCAVVLVRQRHFWGGSCGEGLGDAVAHPDHNQQQPRRLMSAPSAVAQDEGIGAARWPRLGCPLRRGARRYLR